MMKKHIYDSLIRQGYSFDIASRVIEKVSPIDEKKEKELLKIDYQKAKNKYKDKYGQYETIEKIKQYLISKGYRYKDINELKEMK
jgi:SOS response regulatory protein OraA/RecX